MGRMGRVGSHLFLSTVKAGWFLVSPLSILRNAERVDQCGKSS